jgi:hypothetical protein
MEMSSYEDQIAGLQTQIHRLKDRAILEIRVKIAEHRNALSGLQAELEKLQPGAVTPGSEARQRRTYTPVTIEQIVDGIKGGASNYASLHKLLGASLATVRNRIEKEGKAAKVSSTGFGPGFRLYIEDAAPVAKAAAIMKPAPTMKPAAIVKPAPKKRTAAKKA